MFNNINWQAMGPFAVAAAQAQATNMYAQVQQVGQAGIPMMPAMGMGMDQGMQQQQQQQQMYQWYYGWQQQQQQQMPQQPQPGMMSQAVVSMAVLAALWC